MFIGREKETKQLIASLSLDRNVILSGKFGIGRTSLVRHVTRIMQEKWKFLFTDFSRTPDQVCRELESQLKKGMIYKKQAIPVRYKTIRRRIAAASKEPMRHVLVLDNIAKLTAQKLTLISYWIAEGSFLFVAVTETFVAESELLALRMALLPVDRMNMKRMQMKDSMEMIRAYAEVQNLSWTDQQMKATALITRGYPLGIVEFMSMPEASARSGRHDTSDAGAVNPSMDS